MDRLQFGDLRAVRNWIGSDAEDPQFGQLGKLPYPHETKKTRNVSSYRFLWPNR
jgi:hypothetical protein